MTDLYKALGFYSDTINAHMKIRVYANKHLHIFLKIGRYFLRNCSDNNEDVLDIIALYVRLPVLAIFLLPVLAIMLSSSLLRISSM